MNDSGARIVIVGGGVIGLGVAYHLAKLGVDDVLLIERNRLTSGTSWHAAGIVGPLRASMNATRMAAVANEVFPALERETGQSTGYRRTGGFWLARTADRLVELRRIAAIGEMAGLDARMVGRDEVAAAAPNLRVADLAGALWVAEDGQANPVDVCMAYAKSAREAGIRIRESLACTGIERRNGAVHAVRLSDGTAIRCETIVNCAGAWARAVGAMAGVPGPYRQPIRSPSCATSTAPGGACGARCSSSHWETSRSCGRDSSARLARCFTPDTRRCPNRRVG